MSDTCTRVRDAAARGDGLMWVDKELMAHAEECDSCREELDVHKRRRAFQDAFPTLSSIAAEGNRGRAARPSSAAGETSSGARARRTLLLLLLALAAVIFFMTRSTSPSDEVASTGASTGPRYRISNLENALFESKVEGGAVRASMSRGAAAFKVEPLAESQSFVVTLPDGELEVRGTQFVVNIQDGKTRVVDVAEGVVALRLKGRPEMLLKAGEYWSDVPTGRPMVSFFPVTPPPPAPKREPMKSND